MRHKPYQASRSRAENFTFYLPYMYFKFLLLHNAQQPSPHFNNIFLYHDDPAAPYTQDKRILTVQHRRVTITKQFETDASRRKTSLPAAQHSTVQRSAAQGLHCQSRQSAEGSSLEHLIPVTRLNGEGVDEIDDWSERASDSCTVDSPL